jgi:hypothetical protein
VRLSQIVARGKDEGTYRGWAGSVIADIAFVQKFVEAAGGTADGSVRD